MTGLDQTTLQPSTSAGWLLFLALRRSRDEIHALVSQDARKQATPFRRRAVTLSATSFEDVTEMEKLFAHCSTGFSSVAAPFSVSVARANIDRLNCQKLTASSPLGPAAVVQKRAESITSPAPVQTASAPESRQVGGPAASLPWQSRRHLSCVLVQMASAHRPDPPAHGTQRAMLCNEGRWKVRGVQRCRVSVLH